jgi:hypothetical protein
MIWYRFVVTMVAVTMFRVNIIDLGSRTKDPP